MTTNSKQRIEASKMLKFLKKEEAYYDKTINSMKQELMRLQIEELSLKAGIRKEQLKLDHEGVDENDMYDCESLHEEEEDPILTQKNSISENVTSSSRPSKKIPFDEGTSSSSSSLLVDDCSQKSMSQPSPAANDSVMSNITDERYLEPLILTPCYHDDAFVEFDD